MARGDAEGEAWRAAMPSLLVLPVFSYFSSPAKPRGRPHLDEKWRAPAKCPRSDEATFDTRTAATFGVLTGLAR